MFLRLHEVVFQAMETIFCNGNSIFFAFTGIWCISKLHDYSLMYYNLQETPHNGLSLPIMLGYWHCTRLVPYGSDAATGHFSQCWSLYQLRRGTFPKLSRSGYLHCFTKDTCLLLLRFKNNDLLRKKKITLVSGSAVNSQLFFYQHLWNIANVLCKSIMENLLLRIITNLNVVKSNFL